MWLFDTSVKRPVFATVLSLMLFAFGALSFRDLSIREYPKLVPPIISVQTSYPGASANVVESRNTRGHSGSQLVEPIQSPACRHNQRESDTGLHARGGARLLRRSHS
jgi:hypothetical protein